MKKIILTLLFLSVTSHFANAAEYSYKQNGDDWPATYPTCSGPSQSPIDLPALGGKTNITVISYSADKFVKRYQNPLNIVVKWVGDTIKVFLPTKINEKSDIPNFFLSQYGSKSMQGNQTQFQPLQFHFHSGSEHRIGGQQYDFEMHTVHTPVNTNSTNHSYAAMGIIFDTQKYDKSISLEVENIIDNFFESLQLNQQTDPEVKEIPYGELLSVVDTKNRYTYTGSVTAPPCAQTVFWNVVSKVYPIKQKHLDLFKAQLARGEPNLVQYGNFRKPQKIIGQNVKLILKNPVAQKALDTKSEINLALISTIFALAVFGTFFAFIATYILYKFRNSQEKIQKKSEFEVTIIKANTKENYLTTPAEKKERDNDKDYQTLDTATPRVEKEGVESVTTRSEQV